MGTGSPGRWGVVARVYGLAWVLVLVLAGCGSGGGAPDTASATRTPRPLPIVTPTTVAERCKVPFEGGTLVDLRAPDGSVMTGATIVFQTDSGAKPRRRTK